MMTKDDDATLVVSVEKFGQSKTTPCSGRGGA